MLGPWPGQARPGPSITPPFRDPTAIFQAGHRSLAYRPLEEEKISHPALVAKGGDRAEQASQREEEASNKPQRSWRRGKGEGGERKAMPVRKGGNDYTRTKKARTPRLTS